MKNKTWQIVAVVVMVLLFGVRIYLSNEQKKSQERQEQMFRDLSRMQSEQFNKNYEENLDSMLTSSIGNLDSIQKGLDSLGKKMKADQEAFEKKMKQ